MKNASKWQVAFNLQLFFNLILAVFFLFLNHKKIASLSFNIIAAIFLLAIYFTRSSKNSLLNKVRTTAIIILTPLIFMTLLRDLIQVLVNQFSSLTLLITIFYISSYLVVLIPVAVLYFSRINNTFWRFSAITYLTVVLLLTHSVRFSEDFSYLSNFFATTALYGFIYLILAYYLLASWGFKFKPVFKPQIFSKSFYFSAAVLVLFAVWYGFFEPLSYSSYSWDHFFFNWDTSVFSPTWKAFFIGVGAGLFEEIERYIILVILLFGFRKMKDGYLLAIFIASLQFALTHYLNLRSPGATFTDISLQVIFTFAFGGFMAVLFLYTGQLWLPILIHFLTDFIGFSLPELPSSLFSLYGNGLIIYYTVMTILALLITIIVLILGRKEIAANAKYLVEHQNTEVDFDQQLVTQ